MLAQLTKLRGAALDILFPQFCVGCGKEGSFLCNSCQCSLPLLEPPVCSRCGRPYAGGDLCRSCQDWQADIDGIRSPFRFDGVIRTAVHQLKYRNLRAIVPILAQLLKEYLENNQLNVDIIVPVPLHEKRLRERGYNQSTLLARELAKLIDLPLDEKSLVREKYVLPQARTANVDERRANVANVFSCKGNQLQGKRILLIDDVATSGATMNACAAVLKSAGALTVWGLSLAREI